MFDEISAHPVIILITKLVTRAYLNNVCSIDRLPTFIRQPNLLSQFENTYQFKYCLFINPTHPVWQFVDKNIYKLAHYLILTRGEMNERNERENDVREVNEKYGSLQG